jgi:hypothetical protein
MLSIAINLHGEIESVPQRILISGLNRATDSQIDGKRDDGGAGQVCLDGGVVSGTVIHHHNVGVRHRLVGRFHHIENGSSFTDLPSLNAGTAIQSWRSC